LKKKMPSKKAFEKAEGKGWGGRTKQAVRLTRDLYSYGWEKSRKGRGGTDTMDTKNDGKGGKWQLDTKVASLKPSKERARVRRKPAARTKFPKRKCIGANATKE